MTWMYHQSTGDLFHNALFVGTGYSGKGKTLAEGRNNGALEDVARVGPIPRGEWKIGNPVNKPHTGPLSMPLSPVGHDAHGRSAFLIHGNNAANNASIGCIIMAKGIRSDIAASGDHVLQVVA